MPDPASLQLESLHSVRADPRHNPGNTVTTPCRSRDPGNGTLADPAEVFGAAGVCYRERTPRAATTNHETCRRSPDRKPRVAS